MDKKPNVFPKKETETNVTLSEAEKRANFEAEKKAVTNYIYDQSKAVPANQQELPDNYNTYGHSNAVEMMRLRTQQQLYQREMSGVVKDTSLSEIPTSRTIQDLNNQRNEDQIRQRDEQLKKNEELINKYQDMSNNAYNINNKKNVNYSQPNNNSNNNINQGVSETTNYNNYNNNYVPPTPPSKPPINTMENYGQNPSNINPYILELSQPNYNAPFDVIPLPSKGKMYKNKKPNIKLAYMTTADENILTSPNLLQSGEFLEILLNRKILEPNLRYNDLTTGDRNAIMIWLRATAYGEMYPVTILDENGVPFDTEVNLNNLKTVELEVEPDEEGLIDFYLPVSKTQIKFKFLTCGDVDNIEQMVEADKKNNLPINNSSTYRLEKIIAEVNGKRDRNYIKDFVNSMRIADSKALNNYIESIESGIDLKIEVETPGGGSLNTFLPLTTKFFWPNF